MTNQKSNPKTRWDASLYETQHSFVWHHGDKLIELLRPKPGEQILDLGCGTGQLTKKIAEVGAIVTGIDNSPTMIEQAIKNYPDLQFLLADGANFSFEKPFDAVFSNAALHWMKEAKLVIHCIWQALKSGGRFVAEFGGKGNVQQIVTAIENVFSQRGYPVNPELNPWYFPSIGEYATLLEQQGFHVTYAALLERPTQLEAGEQGIGNWIKMFGNSWLSLVPEKEQMEIIQKIEAHLRPQLYQKDAWFADYRRLRVVAKKVELA